MAVLDDLGGLVAKRSSLGRDAETEEMEAQAFNFDFYMASAIPPFH